VRPVGEPINLLQAAEEIRLLNHQGGDILPAVRLQGFEQCAPRRSIEIHRLEHDALIARESIAPPGIGGVHRARQAVCAANSQRGWHATAMRQASAKAEAPSYSEAFDTSMPVRAQITRLILIDQLQRALARLRLVDGVYAE